MKGSKLVCYSFLLSLIVVLSSFVVAQSTPGTWKGYVYTNTTLAENGLPVSAYIAGVLKANTSTITAEGRGFYILEVEGVAGQSVGFQICGVNVAQENQSWSAGSHYNGTSTRFNLTFSRSADAASCTYACGCTGGYCNSGSCASSAPATTPTVNTNPGGGGSSGTTTTTTTTTVSTTSTTTTTTTTTTTMITQTVGNVQANTPTEVSLPASESTAVQSITMQTNVAASNVQLTVQTTSAPSTASVVISSSSGSVYRYLDIKAVNVETSAITSAKFKFKVERTWFDANQIDQTTVNLNRLVSNSWVKLTTIITGGDNSYVFYEATSPGFSVFAITGQKIVTGATTTTVPLPTTTTSAVTTTTAATTTTMPTTGGASIIPIIIVLVVLIAIAAYFYMRKNKGYSFKSVLPQV
ncbi:MAG: PGF-pre-PGF domain-containing protein [Candidatus Aenigmatarchaeota archaeon]